MQTPINPQEHILRLYRERVNNPLWCEDQADVGVFAEGLLSGGRFFNELVQNADDADGKEIICQFTGKELIFSHTGRHFTNTDVEKIIRFAQQKFRDKATNENATGYKGIGFKALASIASKIYIFSKDYSFHFDRICWGEKKVPWQMIPIWTESKNIPEHLVPVLKLLADKVTFVFQLIEPLKVKAQLDQTSERMKSLLFLRNIRVIQVSIQHTKTLLTREDLQEVRKLKQGEKVVGEWIVKKVNFKIPDDIKQSLQPLNPSLCPDRLKTASTIELQFAFHLEKENLPFSSSFEVYNTLPTHVQFKIPYAINAEFLLEAQREHLVESPWNYYLIEMMAAFHFKCLLEIARGEKCLSVLRGLGPEAVESRDEQLTKAYAKGLKAGYLNFEFLPSQKNPKELLKLHEGQIDKTKFYLHFQNKLPAHLIPSTLIHSGLEAFDKLEKFSFVKKFDLTSLALELEKIFKEIKDPKLCYEVLCFLHKHFYNEGHAFKDKFFIPTEQETLNCLSKLSLPPEGNCPLPPAFIQVDLLHPKIIELDQKGELRRWLSYMGVGILSPERIVKVFIASFAQNQITEENTFPLIRYLFQLYREGHINLSDLHPLRSMPVLTRANKMHPVGELFLYSAYDPIHSLENILIDQPEIFITAKYMEENATAFYWKEFFVALGAKQECTLEIIDELNVASLRKKNISFLSDFITYLYSNPNKIFGRGVYESDLYKSFIFFPLLKNLSSEVFSQHFWQTVQSFGKQIIAIDKTCLFASETKRMAVLSTLEKMSYLRFVLNTRQLIKGTDQKFHNANELYSPSFRTLVGPELIAADAAVDLQDELAEYLGFKTKIPVKLCWDHLNKMRESKQIKLPFYTMLLKNIVKSWRLLSDVEKQNLLNLQWSFLAENNSWQSASLLKCFAIEGPLPVLHSTKWFKNVLPIEEMIELATIFSRPVATEAAKEGLIKNPVPSVQFRAFLNERLPLFAYAQAYHIGEEPQDALKSLALQLKPLEIYQADEIPPLEEGEKKQSYVLLGKKLYHEGDWKNNKTKLIEYVGDFLKLEKKFLSDFMVVLNLKEKGAKNTRSGKTVDVWIEEIGISQPLLVEMRNLLKTIEDTPRVLQHSPSQLFPPSPLGAAATPENDNTNKPKDQPKINPIPFPDLGTAATTVGIEKKLENMTLQEKPAEKDWAPQVGSEDMPLVTIAKGKFSPLPPKEKKEKTGAPKTGKGAKNRLSDKAKSLIGRWGETFVIKNLLNFYSKKYQTTFSEPTPGHYHLEGKEVKLDLQWVNHSTESDLPYDMLLKKHKTGKELIQRHIEVKATKGNKIHFFLSEGEYVLMSKEPKYRLYHVLNAGQKEARLQKFANLFQDITSKKIVPIEHKSYEFKSS